MRRYPNANPNPNPDHNPSPKPNPPLTLNQSTRTPCLNVAPTRARILTLTQVANAPLIGNDGAAAVAQEMPSLSQNISSSSREMPSSSREMQMCQMGARETLPTDEMRTSAAAADAPSCYRRGGA